MIIGITLAAGIVQGVTGFGAGIIMMMVLPYLFEFFPTAAGISTAISFILTIMMFWTYRKHVDMRKLVLPALLYVATNYTVMGLAKYVNQTVMKKTFGVFLLILSIYYLFFNKQSKKKDVSLPLKIIFVMISGACAALFGIGGPLMVIYFLSLTHNTHEYLGNIQAFFLICNIFDIVGRFTNGYINLTHIPYFALGWFGILIGGLIANKLIKVLDGVIVQKCTYVMIGFAGIMNII